VLVHQLLAEAILLSVGSAGAGLLMAAAFSKLISVVAK
jgi:hypothetical protein